ncbi:MAG TPA: DnaA regulatory inactivator Hda [Burkholderiales bacterium]|nr:DnaA regulatory inactivator Hda [Burkholderiales bacterium]
MQNQMVLDLSLRAQPTLDNFVIGRNTELIHVLRGMLSAEPQERFVYIWGIPGSGRSHLLLAMVDAFRQQRLSASYVRCGPDNEIASGNEQVDALAVDDVERLGGKGQVALFNIYNQMREGSGLLLASGAMPPTQLELREDLVTRLGWGLVFQVHGLSDEEKTQALKTHAMIRGFELPQEAAVYLLSHGRRDMPSLLAVLDALDNYSLQTKRPVTLPLLREIMQPRLFPGGE